MSFHIFEYFELSLGINFFLYIFTCLAELEVVHLKGEGSRDIQFHIFHILELYATISDLLLQILEICVYYLTPSISLTSERLNLHSDVTNSEAVKLMWHSIFTCT
jgi:hypothetical protein